MLPKPMAKKLDLAALLKDVPTSQLRDFMKQKEQDDLAPAIAAYYETKKRHKAELAEALKAITDIDENWTPEKPSETIVKLLTKAGKPLSKEELQAAYEGDGNVGLPLSQLVIKGTVQEKDGRYSVKQ